MQVPESVLNRRSVVEQEQKEKESEALQKSGRSAGVQNLRLTKHLKELKQFGPCFTGGAFLLMNDETHALACNDLHVTLFNVRISKVIATLE
jgi:hypothetical protein